MSDSKKKLKNKVSSFRAYLIAIFVIETHNRRVTMITRLKIICFNLTKQ
jgi:hypothetical protein